MLFDWGLFEEKITSSLSQIPNKTAVFDADGTLWGEDIGFGFFNYQKENHLFKKPIPNIEDIYKKNPRKACALIVQINQGTAHKHFLSWCDEYLRKKTLHLFSFQKKIMNFFQKNKIDIQIVTASPEWVVQRAARYFDLPVSLVIGAKTRIDEGGLITDEVIHPLPIEDDKVTCFLKKSKNQRPFFAAGNTLSDLPLLKMATHFRLAVGSAPPGHKHYDAERKLQAAARRHSWLRQDLL